MLGTFPKAFSQAATFQGYFLKWQLPKSNLATALSPQPVLAVALGPLAHPSCSARPFIAACGASEGLTFP